MTEERAPWRDPTNLALASVVVLAAALRVVAAATYGAQDDEPASVQAAMAVRAHGYPLLPSGVLYLQGATLSYVLAPFVARGPWTLQWMEALRWPSVLGGTIAVLVTALIARRLSNPGWTAVLATALYAVDPFAIEWSARVRPYGVAQACTAGVLWAFLRLVGHPTGEAAAGFLLVFGLGVFTNLSALLLWPALAFVALVAYRGELVRSQRWTMAGLLLALAPVVAVGGLNRTFGVSTRDSAASPGFVGDHLLGFDPTLDGIVYYLGDGVVGYVLVAVTLLLGLLGVVRYRVVATSTFLVAGWLPVAVITVFILEQAPRYYLVSAPAIWLGAAAGVAAVAEIAGRARPVVALVGAAILLAGGVYRTCLALQAPPADPDYRAPMRWIEGQEGYGRVIVAMAPVAWIALSDKDRIAFLAGDGPDHMRVQRYTSPGPGGRRVDFWNGNAAITSTAELCEALVADPPPLVVVDRERMRVSWAYAGKMGTLIAGATSIVYEKNRVMVRRTVPRTGWTLGAARQCARLLGPE